MICVMTNQCCLTENTETLCENVFSQRNTGIFFSDLKKYYQLP